MVTGSVFIGFTCAWYLHNRGVCARRERLRYQILATKNDTSNQFVESGSQTIGPH